MKKNITLLTVISVILLWTAACDRQEIAALNRVERVLPGEWNIDSMYVIPRLDSLIFREQLIRRDTMLVNVGKWSIPEFEAARLELNADDPAIVNTWVTIDSMPVPINIEQLFVYDASSGSDTLFAYLRAPLGWDLISPEVRFVFDVGNFNANCFLTIVNSNQLIFRRASGDQQRTLYISRKR